MSLKKNDKNFKNRLKIQFEGEKSEDLGGLSREFFHLLSQSFFNEMKIVNGFTLFKSDIYYNFGIFLGLALWNGFEISLNLPLIFYENLMNEEYSECSLKEIDFDLFENFNKF